MAGCGQLVNKGSFSEHVTISNSSSARVHYSLERGWGERIWGGLVSGGKDCSKSSQRQRGSRNHKYSGKYYHLLWPCDER